jgi:hypothetical protein
VSVIPEITQAGDVGLSFRVVQVLEYNNVTLDSLPSQSWDDIVHAVTWKRFLAAVIAGAVHDRHWDAQVRPDSVCSQVSVRVILLQCITAGVMENDDCDGTLCRWM